MQDRVTPDQISFYRENGFLVIEGFLNARELEQWRSVTDAAVRQRLERPSEGVCNQTFGDDYYKRVFTQCINLAKTHEGMRELMFDSRLGEMAGTLAGVDGIRIWHDQALIKPPYGNPTGWHLDDPYWSFYSPDAITIWIALDDATLMNGCLCYLPGTHKTAEYETVELGSNIADLFKKYPEWLMIEPVACPCPAGSAIFHNGLTAHGAGANMTNRPRRAMTCSYMPDGSTFSGKNQNILPDDYFRTLITGDVLNDDQINPLVWQRSLTAEKDSSQTGMSAVR